MDALIVQLAAPPLRSVPFALLGRLTGVMLEGSEANERDCPMITIWRRTLAFALIIPIFLNIAAYAESDDSPLSGLEWRSIGPAFMSGRIADVDWDPRDSSVWYVAVGSGGVWKTMNADHPAIVGLIELSKLS
ncbi:MAG: hypothetical protein EBY45_05210 [Gammaproteobacteria bacterium]|nr:hypothetical protein [Gammaproteobacteria bacterium]